MSFLWRRIQRAYRIANVCLRGEYIGSGWDGEQDYVTYKFHGKQFKIPSTFEGDY